jgi:hypothetical protein
MPQGNSYPAPQLPLNGTEQFTGYQQQGATVQTVTITISQLFEGGFAPVLSSPPPIGDVTPNTGQFTTLNVTTSFTLPNSSVSAFMLTWFNSLPTSLPATAGVLWNNGGTLAQS